MTDPDPDPTLDPTRVRNQPALTTSTGRSWLILGGILAAIAVALLVALGQLPPPGLGYLAAATVALLYAGMLLIRAWVRPGRRRLGLLAAGMLLIAAMSLTVVLIIAFTAAA